jgi:hypothetical protein
MSRNIRLFPTYSHIENQTTNHCLLILKMLYEENPNFLSEVLSILLGEEVSGSVGVQFTQQKLGDDSVPDGEIFQQSFSILIETKLGNAFKAEQMLKHLEVLKNKQGQKILIALGNFDQDIPNHPDFLKIEQEAQDCQIAFVPVSFEQFLQAIQQPNLPKNLVDATSDLGEYFDENNLLPSWKYRLDAVNCAMSFDSVMEYKIYVCPTKGGAYNHRRSLYFGAYRNKCVELIARIRAVVDLESQTEQKLIWKNDELADSEFIKIAVERFHKKGEPWYPARIFVLDDDLHKTKFTKASRGGMLGSKQYEDTNYSKRIGKLKVFFTKSLSIESEQLNNLSISRQKHRESNIWQRRSWEHTKGFT